jgi:hypothetical protein
VTAPASIPWRERAFLRPRELAEVSGRSLTTIRRLVAAGEIESQLEGGCRLVPIAAALAFVGENAEPGTRGETPTRSAALEHRAAACLRRLRQKAG